MGVFVQYPSAQKWHVVGCQCWTFCEAEGLVEGQAGDLIFVVLDFASQFRRRFVSGRLIRHYRKIRCPVPSSWSWVLPELNWTVVVVDLCQLQDCHCHNPTIVVAVLTIRFISQQRSQPSWLIERFMEAFAGSGRMVTEPWPFFSISEGLVDIGRCCDNDTDVSWWRPLP